MKTTTALAMGLLLTLVTACGVDAAASTPSTTLPPSTTSEPPGEPFPDVASDAEVVVAAGETIAASWAGVTFQVIEINDSRCPATPENGIVCVWEGNVVVTLDFTADGDPAVQRRVLEGYLDEGVPVYGQTPSTIFGDVEVTVMGITDEGNVVLRLSATT